MATTSADTSLPLPPLPPALLASVRALSPALVVGVGVESVSSSNSLSELVGTKAMNSPAVRKGSNLTAGLLVAHTTETRELGLLSSDAADAAAEGDGESIVIMFNGGNCGNCVLLLLLDDDDVLLF